MWEILNVCMFFKLNSKFEGILQATGILKGGGEIKIPQYRGERAQISHFIGKEMEVHDSESFNSIKVNGLCKRSHLANKNL